MSGTWNVRGITLGQGLPKICVPLTSATLPELLEEAAAGIAAGADLLEWRADCFSTGFAGQLQEIGKQLRQRAGETPLLFTLRTKREGGNSPAQPQECLSIYSQALDTGFFDLLDIEFSLGEELCKQAVLQAGQAGVVPVVSSHDFAKTPSREVMLEKLLAMKKLGAVVPKLAVMPNSPGDVLQLLGATADFTRLQESAVITMAMGALGGISRMAGEAFGSAVTFGSVKNASAPGQMNAAGLRIALELLHSPDA